MKRQLASTKLLGAAITTIGGAAVAIATLTPSTGGSSTPVYCLICGDRGLADALLNVTLFLPLGMGLRLIGVRLIPAVIAGAACSLAIELAQFVAIAGRDSSPADVLYNGLGAFGGAAGAGWLPRLTLPEPLLARRLTVVYTLVFAAVLAVPTALFTFSIPHSSRELWGEWTPDKEGHDQYSGEVQDVSMGGLAIGDGRHPASEQLRDLLMGGAPVRIRLVLGRPPSDLAPIFSVADDREREILFVGALDQDVVVRWIRWSNRIRLDAPSLTFQHAFAGRLPGELATVELVVARASAVLTVNGRQFFERITSGQGWSLLWFQRSLSRPLLHVISVLWLAILVLPIGYWSAFTDRPLLAPILLLTWLSALSAASYMHTSVVEFFTLLAAVIVSLSAGRWVRRKQS